MFTGIIEEKGKVFQFVHRPNLAVLSVAADRVARGTKFGESVAVNGVCLTVAAVAGKRMTFELMKETLRISNLKDLKKGDTVNLERAMKANSRFGGHFVTGHIDGAAVIKKIIKLPNYIEFRVSVPPKLKKYLVPKGSVCLEGVSLTVGEVKKDFISVYLIPATLKVTTLVSKKVGDKLNIETDIVSRYLVR